jgi:hypothetical protein
MKVTISGTLQMLCNEENIISLDKLNDIPPTSEHLHRTLSPIICSGPAPIPRSEPCTPVMVETSMGKALNLGPIYPDASLEAYLERMSKTSVRIGIMQQVIAVQYGPAD